VEGQLVKVLLDTSAGFLYVSAEFVRDRSLLIFCSSESFKVSGAFGNKLIHNRLATLRFILASIPFATVCRVALLASYNLILGRDWILASVMSTDLGFQHLVFERRFDAPSPFLFIFVSCCG
jgi:hypothetical protein